MEARTSNRLRFTVILAAALPLLLALPACGDRELEQSVDDWHAERLQRLQSETGWLTLIGLHPLQKGDNTVGTHDDVDVTLRGEGPDRIGTLTISDGGIELAVLEDVAVRIDGEALDMTTRRVTLSSDANGSPTRVGCGTLLFYVIDRGELYLRVKDSESEVRRGFKGIDRFPVDEAWRVTATLERPDAPMTVAITNALGQVEASDSPGVLVFELAGKTCRLTPLGSVDSPLFIVFGDETNGLSTYGAGRFLSTDTPLPDGTVVLDFNRATNPPCAFTPWATCPLPPDENILPLPVTAGEKIWGNHPH